LISIISFIKHLISASCGRIHQTIFHHLHFRRILVLFYRLQTGQSLNQNTKHPLFRLEIMLRFGLCRTFEMQLSDAQLSPTAIHLWLPSQTPYNQSRHFRPNQFFWTFRQLVLLWLVCQNDFHNLTKLLLLTKFHHHQHQWL